MLNLDQKQLFIALLLGDGTICSNNVFKLSHAIEQSEYLKWKIQLLNNNGLKNNGLKIYTSKNGYNAGKTVVYTQLSINDTIKALRRSIYKPNKKISRKLLNWLNPLGIAIWYMDDGLLNINSSKQRKNPQYTVKISTCVDKNTVDIIIEYFKNVWNINFRIFQETKNSYSIATRTYNDTINFLKIVKPYIIPSMLYKIRKNGTKNEFLNLQKNNSKCETLV